VTCTGDLALLVSTGLSGAVALDDAPWPAAAPVATALRGQPRAQLLAFLSDEQRQAGIWRCTPGAFRSDHRGYVEFMHVVAGRAVLRGDDGVTWTVSAGTLLTIPDGWTGEWDVESEIVKSFAIFRGDPGTATTAG